MYTVVITDPKGKEIVWNDVPPERINEVMLVLGLNR